MAIFGDKKFAYGSKVLSRLTCLFRILPVDLSGPFWDTNFQMVKLEVLHKNVLEILVFELVSSTLEIQ